MIHKMKAIACCAALVLLTLTACEYFGGGGRTYESESGIKDVRKQFDSEFGKSAWFTDITLMYDKNTGTVISGKGTTDPNSVKLLEKQRMKGSWKDLSEITLQISGEGKPKDFMFTLDQVNLDKVPAMIKETTEKVSKEKGVKDLVANWVTLTMPDELEPGTVAEPTYTVTVEPKTGGTKVSCQYDKNGKFKEMSR